jgi:DNA-binding transcriptional LysR family regulator
MRSKNPISLEVLRVIDSIDRRGSFAKAAEELNKATSALSYSVQKLEEQLDISIFQRQGRRSVLSPAGRLILAEGREILDTTDRLANKAKEIATGWEPRINIAVESLQSYQAFFGIVNKLLETHPTIEIDVSECVLNGGWDALEQGRVDLIVGSPGPVPLQKGFRSIPMKDVELIPVISSQHVELSSKGSLDSLRIAIPELRRIITHDTSLEGVVRSEGLSSDGKILFVQNINQKTEAILSGIGIGHLPRHRVQQHLDSGELLELDLEEKQEHKHYLAWKLSNKGKGLQALTKKLSVLEK